MPIGRNESSYLIPFKFRNKECCLSSRLGNKDNVIPTFVKVSSTQIIFVFFSHYANQSPPFVRCHFSINFIIILACFLTVVNLQLLVYYVSRDIMCNYLFDLVNRFSITKINLHYSRNKKLLDRYLKNNIWGYQDNNVL